jgi:hypothetical protein
MRLVVDSHKYLFQVLASVRMPLMKNPPLSKPSSEHRAEPISSKSYCRVADIDAAFEQEIFDLAQWQWIADIHHHREADDLR